MATLITNDSRMPALLLCGLLGALAGAGGFTFREGEGLAYLGSASKTCANCHIMRDHHDGWQTASHHAHATCNDCHVPHGFLPKYLTKGENGFEHSKAFTLQNFHEPILIKPKSARIVQDNCVRCHGDLTSEMLARHDGGADTFTCARCHGRVGHGPTR
jgi:cytochrome c nitrite reductase small subunit